MEKKLYRDDLNKKIGGVCAGLAEYLNIDVTIIRVIFAIAIVMKGVGVVPYIILWAVLPKKPYFINPNANPNVDYTVPPASAYNPFNAQNAYNPFAGTPQPGAPFVVPPKKRSSAGLIVGIALVVFGSFFLLDEFNLFPDLDVERLWPVAFIVAGIIVVFSGRKNPWEQEDWLKTENKEEESVAEEKPADNNPTV
jgi:phage shock protein C